MSVRLLHTYNFIFVVEKWHMLIFLINFADKCACASAKM